MTSNPVVSVIELAGQYKSEFENGFNKLVKHAATFANSTSKARTYEQFNVFHRELLKRRDEMIVKIQDTQSTLSDFDTATLMRAFSWMAVMLLGLNFGAFLGGILFTPLLEFFLSGTDAALLAYFIVPLSAYYFLHLPLEMKSMNNDDDLFRRHMLFLFATFEGLLTGFIFSDKDLIGIPPIAALTPISIGLIPHFGSSIIGKDHAKLLCLTIGGGFILHLSLGTIIDLSLPYLLLVGLYGFIGFAILQLYVNNAGKDIAITHMYQFLFVYAVIFSQALIYAIFAFDAKELANTTTQHSLSLSFL
ncbi:Interactor of ZYG-11 family protein [Brugia pahangi]